MPTTLEGEQKQLLKIRAHRHIGWQCCERAFEIEWHHCDSVGGFSEHVGSALMRHSVANVAELAIGEHEKAVLVRQLTQFADCRHVARIVRIDFPVRLDHAHVWSNKFNASQHFVGICTGSVGPLAFQTGTIAIRDYLPDLH